MRTLSWRELGYSSGVISLGSLLDAAHPTGIDSQESSVALEEISRRLVVGGWPTNLGVDESRALVNNRDYIDLIAQVDLSRVAGVRRDPARVARLIESYARNISTAAKMTSLTQDASNSGDDVTLTRDTAALYRSELERLMLVEDLPAWNTHVRSSAKLRATPKRHLTDASLAIAALGLDSASLINELNYMGFVFESAVVHDLRIYAQLNDATLSYYLDSDNDEVDAIVEKRGGKWAAFEIKLGFRGADAGAASLLRFFRKLAREVQAKMQSLNVVTGFGVAHVRTDGVNVIPFGLLGV
jgi:predicted AAA+ superfamily ATPase